jgi:hypothetical protein
MRNVAHRSRAPASVFLLIFKQHCTSVGNDLGISTMSSGAALGVRPLSLFRRTKAPSNGMRTLSPSPVIAPARPQIAYTHAGGRPGTQGRDCALTCPRACGHEGTSLVWNAEYSWEYPLLIEAKSPRPTAHTRHPKRATNPRSAQPQKQSPLSRIDLDGVVAALPRRHRNVPRWDIEIH